MTHLEPEVIKQYLLGNASPQIQQAIEKRLLTEESFLEELSFVEEELIDDYVAGNLSTSECTSFEQHFLSTPERHRQLRFALALTRYSSEKVGTKPAEASPAKPTLAARLRAFWRGQPVLLRAATALAAVAILIGAWWFSFPRTPSPKTLATLSLTIRSSVTRGGSTGGNRAEDAQASKVSLPLRADALKISLRLPYGSTQATRHRVELLDEKGEAKTLEITERDEKSVSVVIPADQLALGRYVLKLYATQADGTEQRVPGSYYFTAE
jgi:methionine-rich copper-binding protein CopC